MAHNGDTEVDRALDAVVAEINGLTEGQDGGPPVVLTLGGLVIGGTIIPDWQWFDEVESGSRTWPWHVTSGFRPRFVRTR